jgi:hypothetical protein
VTESARSEVSHGAACDGERRSETTLSRRHAAWTSSVLVRGIHCTRDVCARAQSGVERVAVGTLYIATGARDGSLQVRVSTRHACGISLARVDLAC